MLYKLLSLSVFLIFASFLACALPPKHDLYVRGATTKKELSEMLYQAIKKNDFGSLESLLPDDHHLDILKSTSSVTDKYLIDELEENSMMLQTKSNFQRVIEKGIDQSIQWKQLQFIEGGEKKQTRHQFMNTLYILVEDNHQNTITISFDAIKISDRWFLFQGLRIDVPVKEIVYLKQ